MAEAYRQAGVDIKAGADLVEKIAPMAASTRIPGVLGGLGGFGAVLDPKAAGLKDPLLVMATDGVGTKLLLAIRTGQLSGVGIDLVAMCVNDLIVQGARPLAFLDYFATSRLDPDQAARVIEGIAAGCEACGCALVGGETAEMPGLYQSGDFDLAGFAVGAVERDSLLQGDQVQDGDVLIGLASDGAHSNGFSLIRRLLEKRELALDGPAPWDRSRTVGDSLLTPTRLYVRPVLSAIEEGGVHALAHITGGGLIENIPRVLPNGLGAVVNAERWILPQVFGWLADAGDLSVNDLASTFNCGIGMVLVVSPDQALPLCQKLNSEGESAQPIGHVNAGQEGVTLIGTEAWPCLR